jgi:hypothetical protein
MHLDEDDIEALQEVARAWRGRAPLDFVPTFDTGDLANNRPEEFRLLDAALGYAIGSAPLRGMQSSIPRLMRLREKIRPYVARPPE